MSAEVKIVGAGPGDPELLTIKAYNALKKAKVILYDALVDQELLNEFKTTAKLVYVGKRAGSHSYSQDEINKLLVDYAFTHGKVVRLKGGDPFVFGRGHEELEYVKAFGIAVEVVPGITSAIAIPEINHIPVTKRGLSQSFWVLSATGTDGRLSEDLHIAARSNATVVILMGVKKLQQIVSIYKKYHRSTVPVAIIQKAE